MMTDPRKIREMIALCSFESGRGRQAMKISAYYPSDYVVMQLIKTFFFTLLSEVLIAVLIAGGGGEELLDKLVYLDFGMWIPVLFGIGLGVLILFLCITFVTATVKYRSAVREMRDYELHLKDLKDLAEHEDSYGL